MALLSSVVGVSAPLAPRCTGPWLVRSRSRSSVLVFASSYVTRSVVEAENGGGGTGALSSNSMLEGEVAFPSRQKLTSSRVLGSTAEPPFRNGEAASQFLRAGRLVLAAAGAALGFC